ncbi:MAG TPA: lipocalin family protein [Aridibacter sp.]|nr:lipocalin family protein [Aridibacter sp.]
MSFAESTASVYLDKLADAALGEADSLRDGSELDPVDLSRDLYAHAHAQTEWWYYTGHIEADTQKRFGFELVFFKRRTDLDRFTVVPLRLLGNPIYFAHFALTDIGEKRFRYAHRKSSNSYFDYPAAASESHYYLRLGDWSVRESYGSHLLKASLNSDLIFDASLKPLKAAVLNGPKKDGVSFKDEGEASRYFSFTRMDVEGELKIGAETERFSGSAWMDREFGTWKATEKQKGWDWFSIQLNDGSELMIYMLRDGSNRVSEYSSGVYVAADSEPTSLDHDEILVTPSGYWKSQKSGATYPSGWQVEAPSLGISLEVDPVMENQELDTRGTTMIIYWEGACRVTGRCRGSEVNGRAYIELVGYDRSHESPNLAHFLMGNHFESD